MRLRRFQVFWLVGLAGWLVVLSPPAWRLARRILGDLSVMALPEAERQAVGELLARTFVHSDRIGSVVLAASVFLIVLTAAFLTRRWRPSWTPAVVIGTSTAIVLTFAAGAGALGAIFWLLVLGAAAFELGHRALFRLSLPADRLEALVLRAAVGSGLLSLVGLGLGTAGLLRSSWVLLLVVVLVALLGTRLLRGRRRPDAAAGAPPPLTAFETGLLGLTGAAVAVASAAALAPEVQSDALRLHLAMARVFARDGAVAVLTNIYPTQWPVNAQVLFAMGVTLHGPGVAKLLHAAAGVITLVGVGVVARRLAGRRAGLIAAAVMATLPLGMWEMGTAYVDLFAAGYVVVAALCMLAWQESGERTWLWLVGGLVGFGIASKLTVGFVAAGFAVALLVVGRSETSARDRVRAAAWMALGLLVTLGPWLVRSVVFTGQIPGLALLRDSLTPALGGPRPPSLANLPLFGVGRNPLLLPWLPWEMTFNASRFGENPPGFVGLVPLLALPAVVFVRRGRATAALAVLVGVAFVLWFFSAQYLRYLLPTAALFFVLLACGVDAVLDRALRWRPALTGIMLAALALSPLAYLLAMLAYPGGLPVRLVLGTEPADHYVARILPQVPALRWLASRVPPGTPVAAYPEGYQMYTDATLLGLHSGAPWLTGVRSASEALELFARDRITYFMVDRNLAVGARSGALVLQSSFLEEHAETVYAGRNIYVYRIHARRVPGPAGRELLLNPTFESVREGHPEGWNMGGTPVYDVSGRQAYGGRAAVQVRTMSSFFQTVPVQGGRAYVLRHVSRCDGAADGVRLQVNWLDAKLAMIDASIEVRRPGSTYAMQTMWTKAPERAAFGVIYVASQDEAPCWFDDVSFKEASGG